MIRLKLSVNKKPRIVKYKSKDISDYFRHKHGVNVKTTSTGVQVQSGFIVDQEVRYTDYHGSVLDVLWHEWIITQELGGMGFI